MICKSLLSSNFRSIIPVYAPFKNNNRLFIHRFYDTSPISPSGRYIAATELPFDDRMPVPGDIAYVCVVDLFSGEEVVRLPTIAWDTQVGAHVQWGDSDESLFFNRMERVQWSPFAVKYNIFTGNEVAYTSPVYFVSNSGRDFISPCLNRISRVQKGYGVFVPNSLKKYNIGFSCEDGIYVTNVQSKTTRLMLSYQKVYRSLHSFFSGIDVTRGGCYGFHVKYSPDDSKVLFIIRWMYNRAKEGRSDSLNYLIIYDIDNDSLSVALTPTEWYGGHHPNWFPDSKKIIMNLIFPQVARTYVKLGRKIEKILAKLGFKFYFKSIALKFVQIDYKSSEKSCIFPGNIGSGHPSLHPFNKWLVTDSYLNEAMSLGGRYVPLRLIDAYSNISSTIAVVDVKPKYLGNNNEFRVDPHPSWSKCGNMLVFNGVADGCRTVFVADIRQLHYS